MTAGATAEVAALQAALAAENAAVFGYGVVGAHLAGAQQAAARRDWVAHETGRDAVTAMLVSRHAKPVPAAVAYALPFRVTSARTATALAAYLEDRVTAGYLGLVALTDLGLRRFGARGVQQAALRAAGWRGHSLAFPGLELPAPPVTGSGRTGGGTRPPHPHRTATPPGTS